MKKPKRISVIIPTYNRQNIVINTLEHFCKQASSGFEVIIVDQTNKFEGKLNNKTFEKRVKPASSSENTSSEKLTQDIEF